MKDFLSGPACISVVSTRIGWRTGVANLPPHWPDPGIRSRALSSFRYFCIKWHSANTDFVRHLCRVVRLAFKRRTLILISFLCRNEWNTNLTQRLSENFSRNIPADSSPNRALNHWCLFLALLSDVLLKGYLFLLLTVRRSKNQQQVSPQS